jgi:hypothetical protein
MRPGSITAPGRDCVTARTRTPCNKSFRIAPAFGILELVTLALSVLSLIPTIPALADPWKTEIDASLMLTQTSYSNNWAGGEADSLAWAANSNFLAQKQVNPNMLSKNTVKLAFGQLHNPDKKTKDWDRPVKSTDLGGRLKQTLSMGLTYKLK